MRRSRRVDDEGNRIHKKFRGCPYLFPSPRDNVLNLPQSSSEEEDDDFDLGKEEPEFASGSTEVGDIRVGERVDIMLLLSNNGQRNYLVTRNGGRVQIDTLRGKYIVICCFFLPVLNDSFQASVCYALKATHSQLYACGIRDFEIVLVAKMRRLWDKKSVFKHFLSGFLDNTLAVPFSDSESRDCLCKSAGLTGSCGVAAIVVDPQGNILQKDAVFSFYLYGADFFPFTAHHLETLSLTDQLLMLRLDTIHKENNKPLCDTIVGAHEILGCSRRNLERCLECPVTLVELLQCDYVTKISEDKKSVSVSCLSQNPVGLYLCQDGWLMDKLNEVHQQCITLGHEFEIVVVCLAFEEDEPVFFNHVKLALEKHNISSWWLFPFNDKMSRRLWRLTGYSSEDSLIILNPHKSGELLGKQVICDFGINSYPFTRETLVDKKFSKLKSLTLKGLLKKFKYLVRKDSPDRIPVSYVRGKKMLIYTDYIDDETMDVDFYTMLRDVYPEIKSKHPGSDLIFVPLVNIDFNDERVREMPWLIVPLYSASVAKKLFVNFGDSAYSKLVSFGEDGRILSRCAEKGLDDDAVDATHLFDDMLRDELVADFGRLSEDDY